MAQRQAHPISDADLDRHTVEAENFLKKVKGSRDLQMVFTDAVPTEKYRILPEAQALVFAVRKGICLYLRFHDMLSERTGQKGDVEKQMVGGGGLTLDIQRRAKFIDAYGLFAMASYIAVHCERELKGKNTPTPALQFPKLYDVTGSWRNDLTYTLAYFADAVASTTPGGQKLVRDVYDLIAVAMIYWKWVAERAVALAKESPDLLEFVESSTFTYGSFTVTGLTSESREERRIVTFAEVRPAEVVGNADAKITFLRLCQRLGLYDPVLQRNPFLEFGGIFPSALLDGPPGTGKTTLMRMVMTELKRLAEMMELAYHFSSLTADQVKNEFYGKTAQLMNEFLNRLLDPLGLAVGLFDDIDLLMSPERSVSGGADNDILKALMDFFSGATSIFRGNWFAIAATNRPTGSDSALRQRFVYRVNILGPQSWEDYADLAVLQLKGFAKTGLLKVAPGRYQPLTRALPASLAAAYDSDLTSRYRSRKGGSWDDIGALCVELRKKDPEFTGRAVKNAVEVALTQAADFDVPAEWFEKPDAFRVKSWEERLEMVKALYRALTAADVMLALENQARVEARYREEERRRRVEAAIEEMAIRAVALDMAPNRKGVYEAVIGQQ